MTKQTVQRSTFGKEKWLDINTLIVVTFYQLHMKKALEHNRLACMSTRTVCPWLAHFLCFFSLSKLSGLLGIPLYYTGSNPKEKEKKNTAASGFLFGKPFFAKFHSFLAVNLTLRSVSLVSLI